MEESSSFPPDICTSGRVDKGGGDSSQGVRLASNKPNHNALPTGPEKGSLFMSVKLFVGNLTQETTSTEIRDLFSAVGVVESCQLIADRETGRSRGFGFVEMDSREAADAAKEKFNGHNLHGHTLKVDEAKLRIEK
jgi:RNA recognition motif-containing protein